MRRSATEEGFHGAPKRLPSAATPFEPHPNKYPPRLHLVPYEGGGALAFRLPLRYRDIAIVFGILIASIALLWQIWGVSILQFLINGIVVGSIYVVGATGLTLIYGIRKFANFAHGEMMSFGTYTAYFINGILFYSLGWGTVFAIVATAALGLLMEFLVFRRLAPRGAVSMMVASIGIAIVISGFLNAAFGTSIHQYDVINVPNTPILIIGGVVVLSINPIRGILPVVVGVAMMVFLHTLLSRTTTGKAMRATADNPDLARASGIRTQRIIYFTWGLSGVLAGVAGVLLGLFIDIRPGLGFSVLLFVFAAVIIGGLGSPYGAMFGGFIVGIAQEMAAAVLAWLGDPDVIGLEQPLAYRPIAAFLIMIIVLLLRPGGLLGPTPSGERTGRRWFRFRKPALGADE